MGQGRKKKDAKEEVFKWLFGVNRETFEKMQFHPSKGIGSATQKRRQSAQAVSGG
jgi:hypothetical protein